MLNILLNKGGAGRAIDRAEIIERFNPLLRKHHALNHAYNHLAAVAPEHAEALAPVLKAARLDVSRLAETVLSAGGVPYNGTDMEAEDFHLGAGDEMTERIRTMEQDYADALAAELKVNHQVRTLAVLKNLRAGSENRLQFLKELARPARRQPAR